MSCEDTVSGTRGCCQLNNLFTAPANSEIKPLGKIKVVSGQSNLKSLIYIHSLYIFTQIFFTHTYIYIFFSLISRSLEGHIIWPQGRNLLYNNFLIFYSIYTNHFIVKKLIRKIIL